MSFFVKYYNNFRFNKLAKFSYLILYLIKHPHTHTQKYCITTIFYLFQFGNFVKTTSSICPRVKFFYNLKSKRGYK